MESLVNQKTNGEEVSSSYSFQNRQPNLKIQMQPMSKLQNLKSKFNFINLVFDLSYSVNNINMINTNFTIES